MLLVASLVLLYRRHARLSRHEANLRISRDRANLDLQISVHVNEVMRKELSGRNSSREEREAQGKEDDQPDPLRDLRPAAASLPPGPPSSSAGHSEGEQQQQEPIRRWLGADLQHELASTPTPSLATTSVPRSEQGASQLAIAADGVLPAPPFNLAASGKVSLTPLHRATSSASTKRRAPSQSAAAPRAKKYSNSCN